METQKGLVSAKDFFMHLGAMISLYFFVGSLISLLFVVINTAFPPVDQYYGSYRSISFPVASLIVLFPTFLLLSWINVKSYTLDPLKKDIWIRRWSYYLTLFISGAILLGALVSILYLFLDGRELTIGFVLKVLTWMIVSGLVFGYYIQEIRDKLTLSQQKIWVVVTTLLVVVSVALGFSVIGSPRTQRLMRYDDQKISHLQTIQNQIVYFWQAKSELPETLDDLQDPLSSYYEPMPVDPQTSASYVYTKKNAFTFELCAEFNTATRYPKTQSSPRQYEENIRNENWTHAAGYTCFERTIDPQMYPPFKN